MSRSTDLVRPTVGKLTKIYIRHLTKLSTLAVLSFSTFISTSANAIYLGAESVQVHIKKNLNQNVNAAAFGFLLTDTMAMVNDRRQALRMHIGQILYKATKSTYGIELGNSYANERSRGLFSSDLFGNAFGSPAVSYELKSTDLMLVSKYAFFKKTYSFNLSAKLGLSYKRLVSTFKLSQPGIFLARNADTQTEELNGVVPELHIGGEYRPWEPFGINASIRKSLRSIKQRTQYSNTWLSNPLTVGFGLSWHFN